MNTFIGVTVFVIMLALHGSSPLLEPPKEVGSIAFTGQVPCDTSANKPAKMCSGNVLFIDPVHLTQKTVQTSGYDPSGLSWSKDGKYVSLSFPHQIELIDIATGEQRTITSSMSLTDNYAWSVWSPNSRYLAYLFGNTGKYTLSIIDSNGVDNRHLSNGLNVWLSPDWAPDSQEIVFSALGTNADGTPDYTLSSLYRSDISGSGLIRLTTGFYDINPRWSPSRQIAFSRQANTAKPGNQIFVMNADGNEVRQITYTLAPKLIVAPWSSDGERLLYVETWGDARPDIDATLHLLTISSNQDVILASAQTIGGADWSPDEQEVVYTPGDHKMADICIVDISLLSHHCLSTQADWLSEPRWRTAALAP